MHPRKRYPRCWWIHRYHWKEIQDDETGLTHNFDGAYVQAGYFLNEINPSIPEELELGFRYAFLNEPDNSLIKQYKALLKTEDVELDFSDDGINMLAKLSTEINATVENIGARRLHTIIEKVLDEVSFTASDKAGQTIKVNKEFVSKNLGDLVKNTDLSKFIL